MFFYFHFINCDMYHMLLYSLAVLQSAKIHRLFSFAPILKVSKLPFKGVGLGDLSQ